MIRVSVLYPSGEGKRFDHAYYADTHMALVRERYGPLGLVRLEIDKGVGGSGAGGSAPYACIGHLYFASQDEFRKAAKTHGRELAADIPNFTDIQPHVQISEIVG